MDTINNTVAPSGRLPGSEAQGLPAGLSPLTAASTSSSSAIASAATGNAGGSGGGHDTSSIVGLGFTGVPPSASPSRPSIAAAAVPTPASASAETSSTDVALVKPTPLSSSLPPSASLVNTTGGTTTATTTTTSLASNILAVVPVTLSSPSSSLVASSIVGTTPTAVEGQPQQQQQQQQAVSADAVQAFSVATTIMTPQQHPQQQSTETNNKPSQQQQASSSPPSPVSSESKSLVSSPLTGLQQTGSETLQSIHSGGKSTSDPSMMMMSQVMTPATALGVPISLPATTGVGAGGAGAVPGTIAIGTTSMSAPAFMSVLGPASGQTLFPGGTSSLPMAQQPIFLKNPAQPTMSASEMLLQQQLAAQKVMQAKLEAEAKAKAQEAKARAQAKGQTQSKQTLGKQQVQAQTQGTQPSQDITASQQHQPPITVTGTTPLALGMQSPFITVSAPGAAGPGIASQIMEYDMMSNGKSTNGNHHHDSILQGLQPSIIIQLPSLDAPHQQVIPSLAPEGSMSSDGSLPLTEETPVGTPRGASIEPFGGGGASASGKGSRPNVQSQAPGGRPQIFKATYSGVPVFEMICRGVAVMRRRSDSYLNATQILKVADFDKPQRTRILEREVQKGEHEKVQGGYGKYQGTWVPYERGVQLCQEYNVLQLLKPLLEYQVSKVNSPPLAPKHVTAASNRPRKPREPKVPGEQKPKKSKLKGAAQIIPGSGTQGPVMGVIDGSGTSGDGSVRVFGDGDEDMSTSEMDHDEDGPQTRAGSEESMDGTMSILSARSRTPSPIESRPELSSSEMSDDNGASPGQRRQRSVGRSPSSRKRQHVSRPGDELFIGYNGGSRGGGHDLEMRDTPGSPSIRQASPNRRRRAHATERSRQMETESTSAGDSNQGHYAETLLNYFVSDSTSLPSILVQPPADLDFDLIIDEEGHTPLHWAVAMARTKIVRLLVQHGADIYRVNNQGQTALMRSVLFTNNFDMKTFPTLLEILQKTIFTIDKNDQTVFHHVAVTAGMRGKVHASRYYMECLLDKLGPHPQELASIINVQDIVGDTALIIAARAGNKKVVKLLLDAKADPKIRNRSGRNADDIMREADLSISGASSSAASSLHPPSQQHPPPSSQSLSSTPAQRAQNYPPQQHSLPPQQQQQQQQQQRYPAHQPPPPHHPIGGNGGPNHPRAVGHTSSQQTHFSPSSMPPSASATSTPRVHQTSPHNPHGHPTFAMRVTTPPPPPSTSRQAGHPLSSPNMDRPLNPGYQEYPSRNSFPSHAPPPSSLSSSSAPLYSQHLESGSGRGPVGYGNHPSGDGDERGMAMERSTSSRGVGQLGKGHGRPLQRTISQVTELFEQLTEAYEKDLYEKEQDLLNARNMLQETQTEIQDGQRTIEDLKSKTTYLGEAEAQIKTLENGIREEITLRQRLKLENLVAQEEARLRLEKDGGTLPDSFATTSGQDAASHVQALEQEATELRSKLAQLQQSRKDQVEQIVQLKSQQGKRRHEYRRLIALCCNISVDEVDGLLAPLLNTLGSEDGVI